MGDGQQEQGGVQGEGDVVPGRTADEAVADVVAQIQSVDTIGQQQMEVAGAVGVEAGIVRKAGAWYTYEGDQLGQGKENARNYLRENPDIANEIEKKIKEKLGIGPRLDADVTPPPAPTGRPSLGVVTGQGGAR